MKHRINKPPGPHPYDRAREELKASGGGLFGVRIIEPCRRDITDARLGPWSGHTLISFDISVTQGMSAQKYRTVTYRTKEGLSPWLVRLAASPDDDAEELARLATVFMDLINTQRTN